jgi:hypothetical protein
VAITTDGEYILYLDGAPHRGVRNTLGELAIGEIVQDEPIDIDPSPPTRWGKGYKGPRRETFPLPDEYALDAHGTPLDATTVKLLTHTFSLQKNQKQHSCLAAWTKRLAITPKQWLIIASRYNNTVLTPRDYHLHFKHITHRRIGTNNRFADQSSICRFCHTHEETSVHLGRCPSLTKIFGTINKATGFTPGKNRTYQQKALDTLFCHPCEDTPACVVHLYLIAWRYIITEFYQLHYDEGRPPFDETQAFTIYSRTIERYTLLVMAKAHRTRAILLTREHRGDPSPLRMIQRNNRLIGPLFHLDEGARLTISTQLEMRLKSARIEHVRKNIPTHHDN